MGIPESILPAALEGLRGAEARLESAARRVAASADPERAVADQIDLSEEFVALIQARNSFAASLRVIEAGDEMARHTLEMLG